MSMEKEKMDTSDTDSMTTVNVNVKDYANPMDYQEPPPAYRHAQNSTTVQVTKIIAVAAVVIAAMLAVSIVFSAWISATSCQQNQQQHPVPVLEALLQPEHLKSFLGFGGPISSPDLELSESKVATTNNNKGRTINSNNLVKDASSEEDTSAESDDDGGVTMLKLPLELSLQEHMFENKNHRSHMNCVIEKKKAEEIVDEQSKPLPAILGINITTDPRYLHFTGEKMAISCNSGNNRKQMPGQDSPQPRPIPHLGMRPGGKSPPHLFPTARRSPIPLPIGEMLSALTAAASSPVHIIGPIPLNQNVQESSPEFRQLSPQQSEGPIHIFRQFLPNREQSHRDLPPFLQQVRIQEEEFSPEESSSSFSNNPLRALGIPPHLIPVLYPQQGNNVNIEMEMNEPENPTGSNSDPIFMLPQQSSEIRERAIPHPIPIMPRAHFQHVIRPRRSVPEAEAAQQEQTHTRMKRCSCDCACKNHQD